MAYSYMPQSRLEGYGFYNPNMAGPDWGQGISQMLNAILARREQMEQQKKQQYQWEQEQDLARRRAEMSGNYMQAQVENLQKPKIDPLEEQKKQDEYRRGQIKKAYPNLSDEEREQILLFGQPKPTVPKGATQEEANKEKATKTAIGKFIDDTDKKYVNEITRLQKSRDTLYKAKPTEPDADSPEQKFTLFNAQRTMWQRKLKELDTQIANLEKVSSAVTKIKSLTLDAGVKLGGSGIGILSKIAAGINQAKIDPTSVVPSELLSGYEAPAPPVSEAPFIGGEMGQILPKPGQQPPPAGMPSPQPQQLPPEVLKVIQEHPEIPPEEIIKKYMQYLKDKGQTGAAGNF